MSGDFQWISSDTGAAIAGAKGRCIISSWQVLGGRKQNIPIFLYKMLLSLVESIFFSHIPSNFIEFSLFDLHLHSWDWF